MKQIGKRILTGIMMALCALCLVLAACGKSSTVKFEFETNGGAPIEAVTVEKGETYTLPTPEPREAYSFEGWFDNAEFSGSPVTEVTAETDMKFYAKWEQLYEIVLDLDGGTLSEAKRIFVKEGASVSEAVKDIVPQKAGWQFGAWFVGTAELSPSLQMKAESLQLTARYKVGYTVEIFEQDLDQEGYTQVDDYVGYEYITGASFSPADVINKKGFAVTQTAPADQKASGVLTETMANNTFRLYYDRLMQTVTVYPSYPGGLAGTPKSYECLFGDTLELPAAEFTADGYFLSGWRIQNDGEERTLRSHYIDTLTVNGDHEAGSDEITVDGALEIFAQWSRGYTDMLRGGDVIYLFDEDEGVCYLERCGQYFVGEYLKSQSYASFVENNKTLMRGKLKEGYTFIYDNRDRADRVAQLYTLSDGELHAEVQLFFNADDTLRLDDNGKSSRGSYFIDDEDNYRIDFTSGERQGQTLYIRLVQGQTSDGSAVNLFLMRDDDEYNMPLLQCAIIVIDRMSGQTFLYAADQYPPYRDTPMTLDLDGYGNALMTVGTTQQAFYYRMEGDDLLVVLNRSGRIYASYKLITINGELCYLYYEEEMNTTFVAEDGSTLTLDGTANAVYTPKTGNRVEGYYEYAESAFGGFIITVSQGEAGGLLTFYAELPAEDAPEGTMPTFEERSNSYSEYYYTDGEEIYYTPFIVIDEMEEEENGDGNGTATVYGYTEEGEFREVAKGTVTYEKATQQYHFTAGAALPYPGDVFDDPINLEGITEIVFGAGIAQVSNTRMRVSYWYSIKANGTPEAVETKYTKTYKGTYSPDGDESKEVTVKLVGGFAIVQIEGEEGLKIGMCTTDEESKVSTVQVGLAEGETQFYAVFTDGEGEANGTIEFLLQLYGSAEERSTDGVVDENVTFAFDGKGGATLTAKQGGDTTTVKGTVAKEAEPVEGVEGDVYQFTPEGEEGAFRFVLVTSGSSTYFIRETEYAGTHTKDGGTDELTLDGFGAATYTVGEKVTSGVYAVVAENIIRLDANGERSFFRLEAENKFVAIGNEYGEYYFYTNASYDGYILFLDGELHATLKKTGSESVNITGTYSKDAQGIYTLNLNIAEPEYKFPANYKGELGEETINSQKHAAFIVQRTNARHVYVERSSWHVLTVDDFGNAIRYGTYGIGERGKYTLITEDLLYYESSADADEACIYRYSNQDGTISMLDLEDRGYYTEDLASLRFMKSGFMIFNDAQRYYYDLTDSGEVILYLRDFEKDEEDTNDFGFCPINIGEFTPTLDLQNAGFGSEPYYSANGYAIGFKRSTDDEESGEDPNTHVTYTYKYPVYMDDGTNHVKAYPLETLMFAPLGSANYSTVGTVGIKGTTFNVTVYRETVEEVSKLYFILQGLRFDISPTYHGGSDAEYKITAMHAVNVFQSNEYLRSEFYSLLLTGTVPSDTYGTITFSNEYGTNGRPLTDDATVTANFLEDSPMYGYSIEGVLSEYDEVTDLYRIDLPKRTSGPESTDDYSYRLYVNLCQTPLNELLALGTTGYDIVAYVRVETLEATGDAETSYTVTAERVLLSEPMNEIHVYNVGEYFNVKLETGTETKTEVKHDVMAALSGGVYLISYTRDDPADGEKEGKINGANAYKLVFTERDAGQVGEQGAVKYLQSVTVETVEAEVYFSADGESYVEVLKGKNAEPNLIVHFYHQYRNYTATECAYNEAAGAYIVTTSTGKRFAVKLTEETKKAEFTEIVTYTAADGSYAEFLPGADGSSKSVTLVYFGGKAYTVKTCTYSDATQTYTVETTEDKKFEVKVTDEAAKSVSITDVTPSQP